jgi:hypothetical protein
MSLFSPWVLDFIESCNSFLNDFMTQKPKFIKPIPQSNESFISTSSPLSTNINTYNQDIKFLHNVIELWIFESSSTRISWVELALLLHNSFHFSLLHILQSLHLFTQFPSQNFSKFVIKYGTLQDISYLLHNWLSDKSLTIEIIEIIITRLLADCHKQNLQIDMFQCLMSKLSGVNDLFMINNNLPLTFLKMYRRVCIDMQYNIFCSWFQHCVKNKSRINRSKKLS